MNSSLIKPIRSTGGSNPGVGERGQDFLHKTCRLVLPWRRYELKLACSRTEYARCFCGIFIAYFICLYTSSNSVYSHAVDWGCENMSLVLPWWPPGLCSIWGWRPSGGGRTRGRPSLRVASFTSPPRTSLHGYLDAIAHWNTVFPNYGYCQNPSFLWP